MTRTPRSSHGSPDSSCVSATALAVAVSCAFAVILAGGAPVRADEEPPPELLGRCATTDLATPPYSAWFRPEHARYAPDAGVLRELRDAGRGGATLEIFFGTWCGDSRREVPRLVRLLEELDWPAEAWTLIGVDDADGDLKRSPGREEAGLEIWRVPTVVVRRDGREIGRLVEHPALSLERDLLAILRGEDYRASYRSYPEVRAWLDAGWLADPNVSADGLADRIRGLVAGEGELAAAALVLQRRGDTAQAAKLAEVNAALHRDSSRVWERLARARQAAGDAQGAREAAERSLRLNDDPDRVEPLLALLAEIASPC